MADEVRVDDLTDLWRAGVVLLPTVAIQYAEVARELHATELSEHAAFSRPDGGLGPLHPVWTALRNTMQDTIAVKTRDNLVAAGDALRQIAESYATTDHLSAAELAEFRGNIEDIENSTNPDRRPPTYVPEAPSTDDPHPEDQPYPPGYR